MDEQRPLSGGAVLRRARRGDEDGILECIRGLAEYEKEPNAVLQGEPVLTAGGAVCAPRFPSGTRPGWTVAASYRKCGMICSVNTFM